MRILYLIDSLIAGGAERSLAALAPEYIARGVQLDVACLYERDNVWRPAVEAAGARVISLAGSGRAATVLRTRKLIREVQPDLVHTTLFDADIQGRLASLGTGVPVVCSLVNAAYGPEQFANPAIKAWRLRAAQAIDIVTARRVRRFHAVSDAVADVMAPRLRVRRTRIDVVPRGRDPKALGDRDAARRARVRERLGLHADAPVLLAVGRHEYQKGFDALLHAFASVLASRPAARLLIAGREGTESNRLREQSAALGVDASVTYLGFRDDVPDLLCAADVFVSASRWEGSPGGVLEAMALGTPIVATDIAPVREVLGPARAAWLVPVDDVAALAGAIDAVVEHGPDERVVTARARFADNYTIERVAEEMIRFYERALR